MTERGSDQMTNDTGMIALGYGKHVRARDIIALIPIEDAERGDGRRTYVHVAGIPGPIVASRSQRAILADMERARGLGSPPPQAARRRQAGARPWSRVRARHDG